MAIFRLRCSTPFGIIDFDTETTNRLHYHVLQCSTPFGIIDFDTAPLMIAAQVDVCSTPFGIIDFDTQ